MLLITPLRRSWLRKHDDGKEGLGQREEIFHRPFNTNSLLPLPLRGLPPPTPQTSQPSPRPAVLPLGVPEGTHSSGHCPSFLPTTQVPLPPGQGGPSHVPGTTPLVAIALMEMAVSIVCEDRDHRQGGGYPISTRQTHKSSSTEFLLGMVPTPTPAKSFLSRKTSSSPSTWKEHKLLHQRALETPAWPLTSCLTGGDTSLQFSKPPFLHLFNRQVYQLRHWLPHMSRGESQVTCRKHKCHRK